MEIQKIGNRYLSLDTPVQADDSSELIDLLQDENQEMPDTRSSKCRCRMGLTKFWILSMTVKKRY
jgi:DNA-directed RNA polymerase sigma subunit (sigma70/sigma32)